MNRFEELAHPEAPARPRPREVLVVDLPAGIAFGDGCERILTAIRGERGFLRRRRWVDVRVGGTSVCVTTPAVVMAVVEDRGTDGLAGGPSQDLVQNPGRGLLGDEEGRPRTITYGCPEEGCGSTETRFHPGAPVCADHGVGMVER